MVDTRIGSTSDRRISKGFCPCKRQIRFRLACRLAAPHTIFLSNTPLARDRSSSGNSLVMSSTLAFSCVSTSTFGHGGHNWIWTVVSRSVKQKVHCEQEMNKRAVGSRQNNPGLAHKQCQHHKEVAGKACCRHSVALPYINSDQGTSLSKTHKTSHSTTSHLPPNSHAQHSREHSGRQVRKGVRTRSRR